MSNVPRSLTCMIHGSGVFQLLCISKLASITEVAAFNEIVSVARRHNPAHGITGALLFDGVRFGQLLEGAEKDVCALMDRITEDARHTAIKILHSAR